MDFDTAVSLDDHAPCDLAHHQPAYLAPEIAEGRLGDERADLYSLGATIYEMACGQPPFVGSRRDILTAQRTSPLLP